MTHNPKLGELKFKASSNTDMMLLAADYYARGEHCAADIEFVPAKMTIIPEVIQTGQILKNVKFLLDRPFLSLVGERVGAHRTLTTRRSTDWVIGYCDSCRKWHHS
jgi:hypothetical protein